MSDPPSSSEDEEPPINAKRRALYEEYKILFDDYNEDKKLFEACLDDSKGINYST